MPCRQTFTIFGHVGKEPETRMLQTGTTLCSFSLAYSEKWKDKSGQWQERTDWFRVTAWNKLAERVVDQVGKGDLVYVQGKIKINEYTDKTGQTRISVDVNAADVVVLKKKGDSGPSRQGGGGRNRYEPPPPEDDIPF